MHFFLSAFSSHFTVWYEGYGSAQLPQWRKGNKALVVLLKLFITTKCWGQLRWTSQRTFLKFPLETYFQGTFQILYEFYSYVICSVLNYFCFLCLFSCNVDFEIKILIIILLFVGNVIIWLTFPCTGILFDIRILCPRMATLLAENQDEEQKTREREIIALKIIRNVCLSGNKAKQIRQNLLLLMTVSCTSLEIKTLPPDLNGLGQQFFNFSYFFFFILPW